MGYKNKSCRALVGATEAAYLALREGMVGAAIDLGLPSDLALKIVDQTLYGAIQMLIETKKTPKELVHAVASPGGTTEAALQVLKEGGLDDLVNRAFSSAMDACK